MRLIARDDTFLTAALIASTAIIFQQPLHNILASIQDIESRLHLDLLPALLLLVVAFSFHQYGKRTQARAEARAAVADAETARAQSRVLQQLMALSHALATALDRRALQRVLADHLPGLTPDKTLWVLMRAGERWDPVLWDEAVAPPLDQIEPLAQQAAQANAADDPRVLPLRAGNEVVGVLGVAQTDPLGAGDRRALEAAAAVLAIGIRNMQLFLETRELSLRDGLTGCFNRGHALQTLEAELRRVRRSGTALSIVMFDIDHFKEVNDQYGHLRGDELLTNVGSRLAQTVRTSDVRCRYGGDEFLVILPDTPLRGAQQVAETIRKQMGALTVAEGEPPVSVSVGVTSALPGEVDAKALIDRADSALYRAKQAGRNRVCVGHTHAELGPGRAAETPTVAWAG